MKEMLRFNRLLPRVLIQVLPATIVALLGIGIFAVWVVDRIALDERHTRLERLAAQSSTAVALTLQGIIDTAQTLATNDLVINSLVDVSERERYIPTFFHSLRVPGSADAHVTLADYRGRPIASNTPKVTFVDAPWIDDVMAGQQLVETTARGMTVAVPVSFSNLPEGIVVIEFDANGFADLVKLPIQADAYTIMAADGAVIYSSDASFIPASRGVAITSANEEWVWAETTVQGFPSLRLVVADTVANALVSARRQQIFLLLAIVLSIVAVAIGIVVTAINVVKPIIGFVEDVERVGKSADLTYEMKPSGSDEFRTLTTAFNNMLTRIESATRSSDHVDSILNSMNEFMLEVSPRGRIRSGNRAIARALGCTVEELPGWHVSSFLSGEWDDVVTLINTHESSVERVLTTQKGEEIPVLISVSELDRRNRSSKNLILVLKDITEQVRAKGIIDQQISELERSNTDLEQFAYIASHDLKAPLRAIDHLAQWIEEDVADRMSETSRDHMTLLRGRVSRLEALLDGLLQYARAGDGKADISWIDTQMLVTEVVELLNPPESIQVKIAVDLPRLHSSRAPLQQVFHNLIGNAIKHNDSDHGVIEITGRDLGSHCEFMVRDDGPGIAEQHHNRIFEMFQTLKRRDEMEGSGIGLAVVEKRVRAYGGTISIISQSGKRGTAFCFTWTKHDSLEEGKHAA